MPYRIKNRRPSSAKYRAPKIPKKLLWDEAFHLNRHELDLYLSYGARSCADRELGLLALDRRKNGLLTIIISLVGGDLSGRLHSVKSPSEFLKAVFFPKMVDPGWQLSR